MGHGWVKNCLHTVVRAKLFDANIWREREVVQSTIKCNILLVILIYYVVVY